MTAFLACFAGWAALALAMERHAKDTLGLRPSPRLRRALRTAGALALGLALWQAGRAAPLATLGWTAGCVALSLAAVAVVAVLAWVPRHLPALGLTAALAALAPAALPWF